ncbi:hypothetical protein ACQCVJ_00180 [Bacillus infantis]
MLFVTGFLGKIKNSLGMAAKYIDLYLFMGLLISAAGTSLSAGRR